MQTPLPGDVSPHRPRSDRGMRTAVEWARAVGERATAQRDPGVPPSQADELRMASFAGCRPAVRWQTLTRDRSAAARLVEPGRRSHLDWGHSAMGAPHEEKGAAEFAQRQCSPLAVRLLKAAPSEPEWIPWRLGRQPDVSWLAPPGRMTPRRQSPLSPRRRRDLSCVARRTASVAKAPRPWPRRARVRQGG